MGWDCKPGQTKDALVTQLTTSESHHGATWNRPLHKLIGNTLWVVEDMITHNPVGAETRHRQIVCYHLAYFPSERGWGKQAETESMGPVSYNCPLQFLDAAPEHDAAWRTAVRSFHAGTHTESEARQLHHQLIGFGPGT